MMGSGGQVEQVLLSDMNPQTTSDAALIMASPRPRTQARSMGWTVYALTPPRPEDMRMVVTSTTAAISNGISNPVLMWR